MVPFERALVSSYRPSIVTFPLSLGVSLFPTPPIVSSNFPHVPLGVGGWPLGYEERRCWPNWPCNEFSRFPTYVITIHQRYRRTDRQTDEQTDRRHAIESFLSCRLDPFFPRTISEWNKLSQDVRSKPSVAFFRSALTL